MLYCEPLETKKVSGTFFVFHLDKITSMREEVPDTFLARPSFPRRRESIGFRNSRWSLSPQFLSGDWSDDDWVLFDTLSRERE